MRKFFQENGRKILAVVSVALMVAFFLPSGGKQLGLFGNANPVAGYLGKDKIYNNDRVRAKQTWELLEKPKVDRMGHTLAYMLFADPMRLQSYGFDPGAAAAVSQIDAHPEMFPLMLKEAQRMGVRVSRDEVETVLRNLVQGVEDPDRMDQYREAIANGLMVKNAY